MYLKWSNKLKQSKATTHKTKTCEERIINTSFKPFHALITSFLELFKYLIPENLKMARADSGQCLLECHEDSGDLEGDERMDTLGQWVQGITGLICIDFRSQNC